MIGGVILLLVAALLFILGRGIGDPEESAVYVFAIAFAFWGLAVIAKGFI